MANNKEYDSMHRTTVWSAGAGCHGGCGVKLFVKDGKVVKVEGDEQHPWNQGRSCPRVLALTQYMYHPNRVTTPLKRVGERGEGKWEKISWDEAFNTIEKKFREIGEKYSKKSVIFCQGTGRDIGGPMSLLAYSYGSPNWGQIGLSGQSCYTPRLAAMYATAGDTMVVDAGQFFEKRFNAPEWKSPKCVIVWGHNLPSSCPDAFFSHWLLEMKRRGAKFIVIDPRVSWIASRADLHLRVRSGTDGALVLGMLNIIINEGLYDKEFVEKWTYGFDELKKRVQEYPVEKVAEITWIPKEQIIEAARLYAASKPAAIQWGLPVDMCPQGDVVAQAITHLWSITGNLDVPGGNVIARPSHGITFYPMSTEALIALYGEEFIKDILQNKIGSAEYPMVKDYRHWTQPDLVVDQMISGKPYPIKAAWIQTTNILGNQAADTRKHYEAFKKCEFVVVVDTFQNPTSMAVADIFLPAATFAEKDSGRTWWSPLSITVKAVQVGECKSDWEINFELARRFKPEAFSQWKNVREMFNEKLKPLGMTFEELAERGTWAMPPEGPTRPYRRYERGLLRKDKKPGFNTPTGKVELWSKRLEGWGLDPLPYFEEPPESPVRTPELWKEYPLIMGTGRRSSVYFHGEHRMIPWLREIDPDPIVEIHPEVAAKLDIDDGEWVYIENKRGRIKRKAQITAVVPPWMVMVPHGWWLPETQGTEPHLFGIWEINCNVLIPTGHQSKSGYGGGPYKTMLCRLTKINKK